VNSSQQLPSLDDWRRLCRLLDDDPELVLGVESADETDRWTAVIDGLDDAGVLAYLERHDTGVELSDALAALPRVFRAGADIDPVGDVEGDLPDAIVRADEILAPHALRLVYLEEESDAFPLVVVPISHVEEIIAISSRLGHVARAFTPTA
jgi:hypothetical protein